MGSPMPSGEPSPEPMDGGFGGDDLPPEGNNDKPFDDTPFDAGVEADENESPEKYIQQLSGKLGQSLRKHADEIGQPDFDLEKFAINSVLSATNSSQMDQEDQNDIIKKVKSSTTSDGGGHDEPELEPEMDVEPEMDGENGGDGEEINLDGIDMDESHNPNPMGQTVFQDMTLGVKDGGMEENKYLNLENTNKSGIFVETIKKMLNNRLQLETVEPQTKPQVAPSIAPARKKPWIVRPTVNPEPKANLVEGVSEIKYISNEPFTGPDMHESVLITFSVDGLQLRLNFVNTGEIVQKREAYDEPDIYAFDAVVKSHGALKGNIYGVEVIFDGHPENLTLIGFENDIPTITEIHNAKKSAQV